MTPFIEVSDYLPDSMRFVSSSNKRHFRRELVDPFTGDSLWQIIIPDFKTATLYHGRWPDTECSNLESALSIADEKAKEFISIHI